LSRFLSNPLKWLKRRKGAQATSPPHPRGVLKTPAKPRKSGTVFMHLISIQKSLKSMELAMRQQIDYSWLVQKVAGQLAALQLEAETIGEEELAGIAGQIEAYFETVSEGRLDFDDKGLAIMLEFTNIYKDALADTTSGSPKVDRPRLDKWNNCYQSLMAMMTPSYEETPIPPPSYEETPIPPPSYEETPIPPPNYGETPVPAPTFDEAEPEPPDIQFADPDIQFPDLEESPILESDHEVETPVEAPEIELGGPAEEFGIEEFVDESDLSRRQVDKSLLEKIDAIDQLIAQKTTQQPPDEIPLYDPSEELGVRDVVISDSEIKSAKEYMDMGESRPALEEVEDATESAKPVRPLLESAGTLRAESDQGGGAKSPVELREVERLKAKLTELHEKQEMLSSKMSDILGDYKKAVRVEAERRDSPSIEELDIEDLEDIIFIGRRKG